MRYVPNILTFCGLLALAVFFLHPAIAFAGGEDPPMASFSCGTQGSSFGSVGDSCPATLTMTHLFSFLACNIEQLSSNLMGHMYCSMVDSLAPAVWAAVTLATLFFGISFTIGLTPATGRDAIKFMLKITFIVAFATNGDVLIGVGYKFLISAIKDGVAIVLLGLQDNLPKIITDTATAATSVASGATDAVTGDAPTPADGGNYIFGVLDNFLSQAFHFATDSVGMDVAKDRCKNAVFAVLATMAVAFPLLAYLGLMLLARIVMTFLHAVFGYLYAIVGITFLMVLAPFFVTFYLFAQTRPFFDKWIGYLASFTLQAVLLFASLAFVLMIPAKNLTGNLTEMIMYNEQTVESTSFRFPWQYCTLCDFKIVDRDDKSADPKELDEKSDNFISNGQMVCKKFPVNTDKNAGADRTNEDGYKPISITFAMAPKADTPSTTTTTTAPAQSKSQLSALLLLAGNGIFALIVLAVVVERLLAHIPYLAQKLGSGLGSVAYAPQIGGGRSYGGAPTMATPGEGLANDFSAGFDRGFRGNKDSSHDGISSVTRGVRDGLSTMITGKTAAGERAKGMDGEMAQGLVNRTPLLGAIIKPKE